MSYFIGLSSVDDVFLAGREILKILNSKRPSNFTVFFITKSYSHYEASRELFSKEHKEADAFIQGVGIDGELFSKDRVKDKAILGINFFKERFIVEALNIEHLEKNLGKKLRNAFGFLQEKGADYGIKKFFTMIFLGKHQENVINEIKKAIEEEENQEETPSKNTIIGILPQKNHSILFSGGKFENGLFMLSFFPFYKFDVIVEEIMRIVYKRKKIFFKNERLYIGSHSYQTLKKKMEAKFNAKKLFFGIRDQHYRVLNEKQIESELEHKKELFSDILIPRQKSIYPKELIEKRKSILSLFFPSFFSEFDINEKERRIQKLTKGKREGVIGIISGTPFLITAENITVSENIFIATVVE